MASGISAAQLAEVVAAVTAGETDIGALRQRFPPLHFTACDDDDVPARVKPVAEAGGFRFYGITHASGHCIAFTPELDSATGLVVAHVDED